MRTIRLASGALLLFVLAASAEAQFNTGDVLAGVGNGKIKRFSPTGTLLQTLDSGTTSSETTGMCFDASTNLFGTLWTISQVAKFNSSGTLLTNTFGSFASKNPESCVVAANGNLFFGQASSNQIAEFNPAGTSVGTFTVAIGPRGTDFIDLAADQCTMHYTSEGSAIKLFNVCTNTQLADFVTGLSGGACYAHRIRPNGEELVACTTNVFRVSSGGTILQTYPASSMTPPSGFLFALNLDPDGTTFWTGDLTNGNIYRINIATGAQVTFFNAAPFVDMGGLAVVGEIVVSQPTPTGTVVAATATPTVVAPTVTPTLAPVTVPTLSLPMLGLLALALTAAAAVLLMRR
jgi:sugar lactone lactonase YvrE